MIYEKRTYRCAPGKLPHVLQRFEQAVLPIWQKHGYRPVGFWTELIGDDSRNVHYMLQWTDLAQRDASTRAFASDPTWASARAQSEPDGHPLVEKVSTIILAPTSFSPLP